MRVMNTTGDVAGARRVGKCLSPAALVAVLMLTGCAGGLPRFDPGADVNGRFTGDDTYCRSRASEVKDSYDTDSDSIGDGIGSMIAGGMAARDVYRTCMTSLGYSKWQKK